MRDVLDFLSINGLAKSYLGKTSMTHNLYLTLQLLQHNDSMSSKASSPILYLNHG